jgi:hypothetical protein
MADRDLDLAEERRLRFRIGISLGDVTTEGEDIFGDGVNVAARLEGLAEPGGVCVSRVVRDQVRDRLDYTFEDLGEQQVKNIARPVRVYGVRDRAVRVEQPSPASPQPLPLPDKPSIAVLPFANMSGDPEQEYFADGMVEEIITALSRIRWLFVIARNSTLAYKGQAIDVKRVGYELGSAIFSKARFAKRVGACALPLSLLMLSVERISGPTASMARSKISSTSRTRCRRASPASLSRRYRSLRPPVPLAVRPTISRPTTSICAPMRRSGRRPGKSPRRSVFWSRRSRAIHVTDPNSPSPRTAVRGCSLTIGAKIGRRIVGKASISHDKPWRFASDDAGTLVNAALALAFLGEDIGAMECAGSVGVPDGHGADWSRGWCWCWTLPPVIPPELYGPLRSIASDDGLCPIAVIGKQPGGSAPVRTQTLCGPPSITRRAG